MANLNGPGGFLSSKIGKIGVGILSGNYGAAFNAALDGTSLGATLANLGNKVDELEKYKFSNTVPESGSIWYYFVIICWNSATVPSGANNRIMIDSFSSAIP